jgi:hypothetical protein
MKKLGILVSGLAVLVGVWVTWAKVATAQVNSNDPNVALVDNCDPATFNVCSYAAQSRYDLCGVHWNAVLSAGCEHHRTSSVEFCPWVHLDPVRTDRASYERWRRGPHFY